MAGPYRNGRIHVHANKCDTCVFRKGNPMKLAPGRLAEIIDENLKADTALICHKTTYEQKPDENVCKGFFDAYGDEITALQIAERMGLIELVDA